MASTDVAQLRALCVMLMRRVDALEKEVGIEPPPVPKIPQRDDSAPRVPVFQVPAPSPQLGAPATAARNPIANVLVGEPKPGDPDYEAPPGEDEE